MTQQQGTDDTSQQPVKNPPPYHAHASRYNILMRQSKELGHTAVNTLVSVKNFLQKEINLPSAERIRNNFPRISKNGQLEHRLDIDDLKKIVKQSHEVLAEVQTAFPITLFPDKVCLDRSVITITKRSFFWSSSVISIRIEDVLNVSTNVGPLFGSLTIASRVMSSVDHYEIDYFWRNDVIELKNVIQGYLIAKHSNIDTENLSAKELVGTLRELGTNSGS